MSMDASEHAIQARIRQHRTAAFRLHLVDAAGTPVPQARVHVRLLRHAFRRCAYRAGAQRWHQPQAGSWQKLQLHGAGMEGRGAVGNWPGA